MSRILSIGGVRGRGVCVAGAACVARGHAWQVGGMCGGGGHVWQGDMHGGGVCMAGGRAWQILRDTVNERTVRILLECILVV